MRNKNLTFMKKWEQIFFPVQNIYNERFSKKQLIILFVILFLVFSGLGFIYKPGGFIGFDWIHFYGQGSVPPFYPPWVHGIISYLSWPALIGITVASFGVEVIRRSSHPVSVLVACISLPLVWTLFLGQLEGLALFGLLCMPWLVPFALVKPQVTIFAFLANKKFLLVLIFFLLISLTIWGLWPLRTLNVESYYGEGRYTQNIGLGWWGLPLAIAMMWFSRGDMDMLMLSGCFLLPHLIPYNLLPVTPAIARLSPTKAVIAFLLSWTPFLANNIGPIGWWFGWFFVVWLWVGLAMKRYPEFRFKKIFKKT